MIYIGLFLLELLLLFLFSKYISIEISKLLYLLTRHDKAANYLLALLFLPGTLIHELAHYLMAVLVRVRAVHFTLLPKIGSDTIILGSVGVLKSDLFRRFLIGIAPFLVGTTLLLLIAQYYISHPFPIFSLVNVLFIYGIFTISNTMFSSSKDMEGTVQLLLIVGGIVAILYFFGVRLPQIQLDWLFPLLEKASKIVLIPLGLDLLFLLIALALRQLVTMLSQRI